MFVVIFEVTPKKERWDDYLSYAKALRPKLEAIDGFIDNERFKSKRIEGRLLSLSTWRDEKAVIRWRTQEQHHAVQEKGRFEVFEDYHLRVGEVTDDTDPPPGLTIEQQHFDATEVGNAKAVTLTELTPVAGSTIGAKPDGLLAHLGLTTRTVGPVESEAFESITNPGKLVLLLSWRDAETADAWTPIKPDAIQSLRHRRVRVIRDYGMFERREAPQFYAEVKP
jgi:heme-degrading monooxygenase HmoA